MLVAAAVEGLADLDTATHQVGTGSLDVRDDQVQSLRGAGHRGGDVLAEDDRRGRARRRELDHPPVAAGEVGIEPPAKVRVKALRAIDV
jgi:hypothetical protein